ncbi:hypothetical protein BDD12DRAFT_876503 [Trichophaea hybrida]|nr:hypothetical protein BDD12DRAFT_876503 [Trichophaea hybrida]
MSLNSSSLSFPTSQSSSRSQATDNNSGSSTGCQLRSSTGGNDTGRASGFHPTLPDTPDTIHLSQAALWAAIETTQPTSTSTTSSEHSLPPSKRTAGLAPLTQHARTPLSEAQQLNYQVCEEDGSLQSGAGDQQNGSSRKIGPAGRASASAAMEMAAGTNRVVPGPSLKVVAEGGGREEEMADGEEREEAGEAKDVMMAETATTTTIETEIETGALATND